MDSRSSGKPTAPLRGAVGSPSPRSILTQGGRSAGASRQRIALPSFAGGLHYNKLQLVAGDIMLKLGIGTWSSY